MYQLTFENGMAVYTDTELGISFSVPEEDCLGLVQTGELPELSDRETIRQAVRNPVSGKRLAEIARERAAKTAAILISDATRGVPTAALAPFVVEELLEGGVPLDGICFFVAVGVHRPATEEEMKTFLGDLYGKVRIENHTPFSPENLIPLGTTADGTPLAVNRRAYECDLHIQIGKVEPHEFAGFSGGRKSVLPGISSEETIRVNHRPERILDPRAAIGRVEDNPISMDMEEAAERFRMDFGVNCILNNRMKLAAVYAGGMRESHRAAIDFVRSGLGVSIEKPDLIVTCPGQPLDIDLYQSVKALIALTEVLDRDTAALFYCGCPEGVN
ncbi:MAG: nickel-dependent lactate racemase, partial [Clostridia bacterium]|nr:nickel-dependent lactate racemase [Clostridia bacterium]